MLRNCPSLHMQRSSSFPKPLSSLGYGLHEPLTQSASVVHNWPPWHLPVQPVPQTLPKPLGQTGVLRCCLDLLNPGCDDGEVVLPAPDLAAGDRLPLTPLVLSAAVGPSST
jgi:hypothetical protein